MRRRIVAVDNPMNGYVEGDSDGDNLGMFVLSPRATQFRNFAPEQDPGWYLSETMNLFHLERLEFDTGTL